MWADRAEAAVENILEEDPPNPKAECTWRNEGVVPACAPPLPPPTWAGLEEVKSERTNLYSRVPFPGEPIPTLVTPAEILDELPGSEGFVEAVWKLRQGKLGRPSSMRGGPFRTSGGEQSQRRIGMIKTVLSLLK